MKSPSIQKIRFLFLLGVILIIGVSVTYLFTAGMRLTQQSSVTPTAIVPHTPLAELTQENPPKTCSSTQRSFEMGVAFPQWSPAAYGDGDAKWLTELPAMQTKTAACWVEIPVLFSQASLMSTTVTTGPSTPTLASFTYGLHFAHSLGFHVFVTPLLQVGGSQPWSGAIRFTTYAQEQQWFVGYWQAIKPYVAAAAQAGVEQLSIGTEYEWLQENAPDSLWNGLITEIRSVFPGALTYDMNWTSLQKTPRTWMHNTSLKMIGISAYLPIVNTPERIDPKQIFGLWKSTVKLALDNFATALGEPIFVSEIGYRNSADALYHSWETTSTAPADPEEQAAACDAALANIIPDQHIVGNFFWGWDDVGAFNLNGQQAVSVIHTRYSSLQASH